MPCRHCGADRPFHLATCPLALARPGREARRARRALVRVVVTVLLTLIATVFYIIGPRAF